MIKLLIALILLPCVAWAAPAVTSVSGSSTLTITGTSFGTKTTASPIKFANFESDTVGQDPSGWITPETSRSLVTNLSSHSGTKSLDSSAIGKTSVYMPAVVWDMQTTIPLNDYLYLSFWIYLDDTGTTTTNWNWKGPLITSSNQHSYYWLALGATSTDSTVGFAGYHFGGDTPHWGGTAYTPEYSADNVNTASGSDGLGTNGWSADAFLFRGWQRVEYLFKTSSSAGAADATILVNRIGASTPILQSGGFTTHGNTSDLWRYVKLPQGFTNIDGTLNLKMYWDDVYIEKGLARVEMCDSSTWAARTHCEIHQLILHSAVVPHYRQAARIKSCLLYQGLLISLEIP